MCVDYYSNQILKVSLLGVCQRKNCEYYKLILFYKILSSAFLTLVHMNNVLVNIKFDIRALFYRKDQFGQCFPRKRTIESQYSR